MNEDYRIPAVRSVGGSPEQRTERNLAAIRVLRACEADNRAPTDAEREVLASYVGWGAVPQLFAALKPEWQVRQQELRAVVSEEEYEHARRSTTNAHYTSDVIVDAIWEAMRHLGMQPGMTWLEPALGVGNFLGRQPEDLRVGSRRFGVEKDTVTGKIAKLLYPESTILIKPFEDAQFPKNYFDAAISNVPFGDYGVFDAEFTGRGWLTKSIHNYFFVKALEVVRPGGLIAFITSRYTLDAYSPESNGIRKYLAGKAELLGAVRLPAGAFRESAGTEVVADILFFRKRLTEMPEAEAVWLKSDWRYLPPVNHPVSVNNYFQNGHQRCILGEETVTRSLYSRMDYTVRGELDPGKLRAILAETLPTAAFEESSVAVAALPEMQRERGKSGALFFEGDRVLRRVSETMAVPVLVDRNTRERIAAQLDVRDVLVRLLDAERTDKPVAELDRLRAELNVEYRRFVLRFGALSKRVNQAALTGDPDAPLLLSLEREFDPATQRVEKAAIFTKRVLEPARPVDAVGTGEEALSVSLNETGSIDWQRMSDLTGRTEDQLKVDLAGLVFEDPHSGQWETAEEYLSGAVRKKLVQAQARATVDPRFLDNVAALEKVLPEDIPPSQIVALLGVTWVPAKVYGQFIQHVMNADSAPEVHYINGEFSFHQPYARTASKWATADVTAYELLRDSMNLRRIKVYRREGERTVVDQQSTLAARDRQGKLNEYFTEWLFATDDERTAAMTRIYNERVNDLRLRTFDGSHLTFPGMSRAYLRTGDLEPYQKAGVWRQICQRNCYLAHTVGSGKSFEAIAGAMELRRLGLIRRPMFVVPNATLGGWLTQFQALYPAARVIVFSERDLERERRQQTMARIATSDWDAVVVPHSSFQLIPVGQDVFDKHYRRLSRQLEEAILDAQGEGLDSRFIKRLEKQKEKLLTSLTKRYKTTKDKTVTWEQLTVDHLVVDECFPGNTRVETEHGPMEIKTIVDARSDVRVKSVNRVTGMIEWKRVTNWYRNADNRPQVKITHEAGSFVCTADHKIWTEEDGYVAACLLSQDHSLRLVPTGEASKDPGTSDREALLSGVSKGTRRTQQEKDEILCLVRAGVHIQMVRAKARSAISVLWDELRGEVEDVPDRSNGLPSRNQTLEATKAGAQGPGSFGSDEDQQSNGVACHSRENASEADRAHLSRAGWKWAANGAAEAIGAAIELADGVPYLDSSSKEQVCESASLLQSGSGGPGAEAGYRGRREDPQATEVAIPGPAQDGGAKRSRVVSVEIYKLPGDVEPGSGSAADPFVYCLEVEDNHNFFADGVLVSNCHEYKRLGFSTKQPQVAGIDPEGNQKTFDLLMKVRYTQEQNGRCVFLSGTPCTNTMGELYNIMQYLIPGDLETRGLGRFDEWAAAFGQVVDVFEPKPEGGGYQVKGRFARFVNVPELAQLFRSFADVLTSDMLDIPRPAITGGERQSVVNELNPAQQAYMKRLQDRAYAVRKNPKDALPDCMLAIYGDAQLMALEVRMVMPGAPDYPDSRVNRALGNLLRHYRASAADRGTQLVFSDFGKPLTCQRYGLRTRFSVYDDLIAKLVAAGIPRAEIAHIYEPRNRLERAHLFRRVNAGEVRILIGSTAKMGLGVNVQERVVAMHHLTLPHRPSDLEQREGRGLRQGNRNGEVEVLYYITKGSLDELKFANVARKSRAFAQFMQGKSTLREMEDIDDMTPSLEAFQAAASGDPRVRRKLEVDNELMRLGVLHSEWRNERWKKRRDRNYVPHRIARAEEDARVLSAIGAARDSAGRSWTVDGKTFTGESIQKEGALAFHLAVRSVAKGLEFELLGSAWGSSLEGNGRGWLRVGSCSLLIDARATSGAGLIQSVEYFIRNVEAKIAKQQEEIARAEKDAVELDTALAEDWEHAARYEELRVEQRELFVALGGAAEEGGASLVEANATVVNEAIEAEELPDGDDEFLQQCGIAPPEPSPMVAVAVAPPLPVEEAQDDDEFIWT